MKTDGFEVVNFYFACIGNALQSSLYYVHVCGFLKNIFVNRTSPPGSYGMLGGTVGRPVASRVQALAGSFSRAPQIAPTQKN